MGRKLLPPTNCPHGGWFGNLAARGIHNPFPVEDPTWFVVFLGEHWQHAVLPADAAMDSTLYHKHRGFLAIRTPDWISECAF